MTGTAIAPSAGWYPDPTDAAAQRWWDGIGWTTHVRPVVELPVADRPVVERPVERPTSVEQAAPASLQQYPEDSQPRFGSLEWRDRTAAGTSSASSYAPMVTVGTDLPNHEANRALLSGGLLVGLLVVDLVFQLPTYVRITGIIVAIVLGLLGLRRWGTTGTGLKRSVAGLSIGAIMGVLALVGVLVVPGFQHAIAYSTNLEQAIVDTSNSLEMPALAVGATCPMYTAVPPVGTILECNLSLEDGSRYEVTVTVSSAEGTSTIVIQPSAG